MHLDVNKVLSQNIWSIKNQRNQRKNIILISKHLIKSFYESFFFEPIIYNLTTKDSLIFYMRTYTRPDVDAYSRCYESLNKTTLCIFANKIKKINLRNFLNSFYCMWKLRSSLSKILQNNSIKLFSCDGIELFTNLYISVSNSQKVFKVLLKHSKLVSFQEMVPTENMICQIANINKLETYALEQGIGFYKHHGEYWEKFPITQYLNSVCKFILCWGEFSKNIFDQHTNAKKYIIGKAYLPKIDKIEDGLTFIFQNKDCTSANEKLMDLSNLFEKNDVKTSRWFKKNGDIVIKNSVGRDGPLREIVVGCSSNLLI